MKDCLHGYLTAVDWTVNWIESLVLFNIEQLKYQRFLYFLRSPWSTNIWLVHLKIFEFLSKIAPFDFQKDSKLAIWIDFWNFRKILKFSRRDKSLNAVICLEYTLSALMIVWDLRDVLMVKKCQLDILNHDVIMMSSETNFLNEFWFSQVYYYSSFWIRLLTYPSKFDHFLNIWCELKVTSHTKTK